MSNTPKDPIPAFKPLKRQGLIEVSSFDIFNLLITLLGLFFIIYAAVDVYQNGMPKEERDNYPKALTVFLLILFILIGFIPAFIFALIIGAPIFGPCAFASSALINYTAFYGAYDDDTVLDRIGRFFKAIAKGFGEAFRRLFGWSWRVLGLRRNTITPAEEFEV